MEKKKAKCVKVILCLAMLLFIVVVGGVLLIFLGYWFDEKRLEQIACPHKGMIVFQDVSYQPVDVDSNGIVDSLDVYYTIYSKYPDIQDRFGAISICLYQKEGEGAFYCTEDFLVDRSYDAPNVGYWNPGGNKYVETLPVGSQSYNFKYYIPDKPVYLVISQSIPAEVSHVVNQYTEELKEEINFDEFEKVERVSVIRRLD